MKIQYIDPLFNAWGRMKTALFQPFQLGKWFILGFAAFLAELTEFGSGAGFSQFNYGTNSHSNWNMQSVFSFPALASNWIAENPELFILSFFGLLIVSGIGVLLIWLSSRGSFMFLDNVVKCRAEISLPWNEYKKEGNSLFLWSLVFSIISFAAIIILIISLIVLSGSGGFTDHMHYTPVAALIGWGFLLFAMIVVMGYILQFLKDFIVPIMYKKRITCTRAWREFHVLFSARPFTFILYGLFYFVLDLFITIIVLAASVLTCCLGFCFLVIPYIGSVALLPFSYTKRAFSVEFLEQFGEAYHFFEGKKD